MLADAYFPLRYLIAVRLLHMKSKICQNFVSGTVLYTIHIYENWSLDDFLLQLSQRITCCTYLHVSYFLNTKKNCIINRKLFVNFPPNCLWKTCCFSSISFIQDSFILKRLLMIKNAKLSEMIKLIAAFYTDN